MTLKKYVSNIYQTLPITDKGQLGDLGVVSFHLPTEESVGHGVKQSKTTTNGCQQIFLKQKLNFCELKLHF